MRILILAVFLLSCNVSFMCHAQTPPTTDVTDCISGASTFYRGTRNVTHNGLTCQRWDRISPHRPRYFPADGRNHNFCRNPNQDIRGTWCYTTDRTVSIGYCGIPKCGTDSKIIWTSYDSTSKSTRVLSMNADPELIREQSGPNRFNRGSVNISFDLVLRNAELGGEYWSLASDYDNRRFFFADYRSEYLGIRNLAPNRKKIFHEGMAHGVESMAYDWMTQNLYWADSELNWIMAADKTFQYYSIVYKTSDPAYALALHGIKRLLFFSTHRSRGSKIFTSDLGGENLRVLFQYPDVNDVSGITVDYAEDKIYWTDFISTGSVIVSSNTDGTNKTQLYQKSGSIFWGIATYSNYIYFTDVQTRINSQRKRYYYMWYITKTLSSNRRRVAANYRFTSKPRALIVYSKNNATSLPSVYPNGECSGKPTCAQICLPRLNKIRKCACSLGYKVSRVTKCIPSILSDNFLMVSDSGQGRIFTLPLNASNTTDYSIVPIGIRSKAVTLSVNVLSNVMYWYDRANVSVWKAHIDGSNASKILSGKFVKSMVVDPQTGYVYFADDDTEYIYVMDQDGNYLKTLMKPSLRRRNTTSIKTIDLDLKNKYIYWTDSNNAVGQGELRRMRFDGSRHETVYSGLIRPQALYIDHKGDRLFLGEATIPLVYEIPLNNLTAGSNTTVPASVKRYAFSASYRRSSGAFLTEIKVLNNTMYMYDALNRSIEVVDLVQGVDSVRPFGPREFFTVKSLQIISSSYQQQIIASLRNPCPTRACPQLCLATESFTFDCDCQDGINSIKRGGSYLCIDDGVKKTVDNPPLHGGTCRNNIRIRLRPCENSTNVTWSAPTWTDDITSVDDLRIGLPNITSPAILGLGTWNIAYTATDKSNNTGHCSFTIRISRSSCGARPALITRSIRQSRRLCVGDTLQYDITCRIRSQMISFGSYFNTTLTNRCMRGEFWAISNLYSLSCQNPTTTSPASSATTSSLTSTSRTQTSVTTSSSITPTPVTPITPTPVTPITPTPVTPITPTPATPATPSIPTITPTISPSTIASTSSSSATSALTTKGLPSLQQKQAATGLSQGATAAIIVLVVVLVVILAILAFVSFGKKGTGAGIRALLWRSRDDTINLQSSSYDNPNHYTAF